MDNDSEKVYLEALENLFSISEGRVKDFNATSEKEALSVYKLPKEFLEMFLDIPGRRGGFCIISQSRLVIFFDEDPEIITIIGKSRNTGSSENITRSKPIQLFKISFLESEGKYEYRDNTGGLLDPYDIISILIKWLAT